MKIRYIIIFILAVIISMPAKAVLKEKDLGHTLKILRAELQQTHDEMGEQQKVINAQSEQLRDELIHTMNRSNQNALMLYSQKMEYVFDLTYACHEATEQYHEFQKNVQPFRLYVNNSSTEVARYDSLINSLSKMQLSTLDERARIDRNVCLALAVNIRRMVVENAQALQEYMRFYDFSENKLRYLNDYALHRYNDIQSNIFVNGGDSYFTILMNLKENLQESHQTVEEKYGGNAHTHSQWDSRVIIMLFVIIMFYGIVAVLINQLALRFVMTRLIRKGKFEAIKDTFLAKRRCIIMASTVITFAVILCLIRMIMKQNFLLMASNLLVEYAWLLSVILISILIRVDAKQTMNTIRIYAPLIFIGFMVITFRIVLIPNTLVNLIFPPVLLICALWQFNVIKRLKKFVQRSDNYYAYFSFAIFTASVISSWVGYTLLSVQMLIWWLMQLTCILTITCLRDWYTRYAEDHNVHEQPITKTWFYLFFKKVITPAAAVISFMISIYWAADVFNLTDLTWKIFHYKFIDTENFAASIISLAMVLILWFVFNYVNYITKEFIKYQFNKLDPSNAESRAAMVINVVQVLIWGIWFIGSLAILHVSNTWLVVISGGLSTGIGFASKDILENIYYGISLMAGRIKIGDLIVCDGTRGRVSSISYTSTMIEATDGSVIAFQNSQLFTKNYKNLTRNHGFEAQLLEVGVAYGTNVAEVRRMLIDAISKLPCVDTENHKVVVLLKEFADSALTLRIVVWLDAMTSVIDSGEVMECIYDTLNENGIEIPFPQRDIHMIAPAEDLEE